MIGGSEVTFEGLLQADSYWYDDDFQPLDGDGAASSDGDTKCAARSWCWKARARAT